MIKHLLKELETHLDIPHSQGSGDYSTYFKLQIAPGEEAWVKELDPGVFMQSPIGPLPTGRNHEEFFSYLMRANFLGQGTGGCVIGLDPDEKFLTLSCKIPYEINYRTFKDELENFMNYLSYWREKINHYGAGQVSQNPL